MKPDLPDNSEESLDHLLNELSFAPAGALAVAHQAPAGLRQHILRAQQQEQQATTPPEQTPESWLSNWFRSPWRAIAASAAPLLLGVLLGSNTSAAEFYAANINASSYPDDDQLLVLASLDSDFADSLSVELPTDWAQDGATATPTTEPVSGGTTP